VVKETRTPLLHAGIPLIAGLAVAHALVPPHPGPMVAIELLKADAGKTILYSLLVGFPTAIIAGPIFGKFIARRVPVNLGKMSAQFTQKAEAKHLPDFSTTIFTILLPVVLMMLATAADVTMEKGRPLRQWIDFIGSPTVAMLLGAVFSFFSFGYARGFDKHRISKFAEECLGPVANVLLIVGAGGGFSRVLVQSGLGQVIAEFAQGTHLSLLLFGWVVAALIRVATGSATVAISTAAGIVAPIVTGDSGAHRELIIIAMGAGSGILSHLNDGGFWFVKEYYDMTVTQTLQTWTVMVTIKSIVALLLVLLLDVLL
jgi:GntP family gluconate:H+ symporter